MNNFDKILEFLDHPDNYGEEEISELLSDKETRSLYHLLCETESTVKLKEVKDIESEWMKFASSQAMVNNNPEDCNLISHKKQENTPAKGFKASAFHFFITKRKAASVIIVFVISIAAVAAGIGISRIKKNKSDIHTAVTLPSTVAPTERISKDGVVNLADSIKQEGKVLTFENESLKAILKKIEELYEVNVIVNNEEAATLKLYYKLDTSLPLREIIDRLNTFEQINIRYEDNTLTID